MKGRRRMWLWGCCRWLAAGLAAGGVGGLNGCASSPPTRFYELRPGLPGTYAVPHVLDVRDVPDVPDVPGAPSAGVAPGAPDGVWELSPAVALPAALDRDTLMVASGAAGLEPLPGHRWATPLRDAVPRLLLLDLQGLRGAGRVWAAPAPAGVQATHKLRVEVLQLVATSDRRLLQLQAQWWWQAAPVPTAQAAMAPAAPRVASATLELQLPDTSIDTLAAGHRVLLWRLAQRVAGGVASTAAAP